MEMFNAYTDFSASHLVFSISGDKTIPEGYR